MEKTAKKGFTLIEVIVTTMILVILASITIVGFVSLQKRTYLSSNVNNFVEVMRLARSKTIASKDDKQYGVYIDVSASPNKYVLFEGITYGLRDPLLDQNYSLTQGVNFSAVNLGGGGEINFDRLIGSSAQSGDITFQYGGDNGQETTIYISNSGVVSFNPIPDPLDAARITDSRHVHFDYSRIIIYDTSVSPCTGEIISLYFDGASSPQQQIPICSNMVAGDIDWSGTVDVGGEPQVIAIRTHGINGPKTVFSIHRSRALNTKSLIVKLSGDSSGSLASYPADGINTGHNSAYVENFLWQ